MKQLIKMKRLSTILFFSLIALNAKAQKINKYNYKVVDTLITYSDAQIMIYKDNQGKFKTDTVYYKNLNKSIKIDTVDDMSVYDIKIKRH